jgi:hypothetical protein
MKSIATLFLALTLGFSFLNGCKPKEPSPAKPSPSPSSATSSSTSRPSPTSPPPAIGGSQSNTERPLSSAGGKGESGIGKTGGGSVPSSTGK